MNTALQLTKAACWLAITAAVCVFLWRVESSVQGVATQVSAAATSLGQVIQQERDAQTQQTREFEKTLAATKETLVRTDRSLNGGPGVVGLLPEATSAIEAGVLNLSATSHHANDAIDRLSYAGQETLEASTHSLETLDSQIANPDIRETIGHLNLAALHFEQATANGNSILAHGDHVAGFYDARLTTPVGFVKTLGAGLYHLIVPATNLAIALK